MSNSSSSSSSDGFDGLNVRPRSLEERHKLLNFLFGFHPSAAPITKTSSPGGYTPTSSSPMPATNTSYRAPRRSFLGLSEGSLVSIGNVVWLVCFGWWLAALYWTLAAVLALTWVGRFHAGLLARLGVWIAWPFGRALEVFHLQANGALLDPSTSIARLYGSTLSTNENEARDDASAVGSALGGRPGGPASLDVDLQFQNTALTHDPGVERLLASALFYGLAFPLLALVHGLVAGINWMCIVTIPMADLNARTLAALYSHPLALYVGKSPRPGANIVLCTYHAANARYFKYERFGVSVVLLNLVPFVVLTIILGYLGDHVVFLKPIAKPGVIFVCSLLSTIPIASVIGLAIASISAQSSFAVGATLNATFGSIIELILYAKLLLSGYSSIVKAGVTGSLLGVMLLLPGLSMIAGGLKFKSQRFNATAAGVSSTLLLIAITGAFAPTVFYATYGGYSLSCGDCSISPGGRAGSGLVCSACTYVESALDLQSDPVYNDRARPLSYVCAALLPMAYFIGLLFTLKTHKHIYEDIDFSDEEEGEMGGHDAPAWSNLTCIAVLLGATVMFALISETLVDSIQPILSSLGLSELFLGISIIALVPNTAEFISAAQFALQNNVMLSMEIGASAAVQITLIQMPVLTFFSAIVGGSDREVFSLIFPQLHLYAIFLAVLIINYHSLDGRASYFGGASFVIAYGALIAMFYFVPTSASESV